MHCDVDADSSFRSVAGFAVADDLLESASISCSGLRVHQCATLLAFGQVVLTGSHVNHGQSEGT